MAQAGQAAVGRVMEKASGITHGPEQSQGQSQQQQEHQAEHQQTSASATSPGPASSALPAAFPKRRRGRPPGRPNATVREADYEGNPLVETWNAAKTERPVPAIAIAIRAALTEQSLVHDTQRAIYGMPSREFIHYVQGWITPKHIASQRPSYVNGLLIHSRGQDAAVACVQCAQKRAKHALGPFMTCRVLPGSFHNSCSNCKWFDNTSSCSLYTGPKPNRKRKAKEELPPPPAPGTISTDHNAAGQYEVSNSESAEIPSQPDSLSEPHFVLARRGMDGDAHADDTDFVDAQLAAQLLPEIQRQDV